MATWSPIALSAIHHKHLGLGATMVENSGWQRPARYTSVEDEVDRLQQAVGICDISPVGKMLLQSEAAISLLEATITGIDGVAVGQVRRLRRKGDTEYHDVVVAYLAVDEAFVLISPNGASLVAKSLAKDSAYCAHAVDMTSAYAGVMIVGPLARGLLGAVTEVNVSGRTMPDMSCLQAKVAEIHALLLRRDLGGLLCYELYIGREFGEYIWDTLMEAGEEYHIVPFGIEALARLSDNVSGPRQ